MNFENKEHLRPILNTAKELLKAQGKNELVDMFNNADIKVRQTGYDNWNGGVNFYTMYIDIDVPEYVKIENLNSEKYIIMALNTATKDIISEKFENIIITPKAISKIDWTLIENVSNKKELIRQVEYLKETMISVATGGPKIQSIDEQYQQVYYDVERLLKKLDVENPNPHNTLWNWYSKWSNDIHSYQGRREYINGIYNPLISILSEAEGAKTVDVKVDLSDWDKINRNIIEINKREKQALDEEQFQAVGMLCRELITTLALIVFDLEKHTSLDGTDIGRTDAKRMLDAYIAVAIAGGESEELRAYAKATNRLANALTHKRTATKKEMMLCTSATIALINFIGVLEDKI
ncbi:MAG: hypothetical protein LBQ31_04795 [Bacteroidales bacterium]|jgi:hypothetical protein|nr:hypothetical protein [Bacteroidales bacterium]